MLSFLTKKLDTQVADTQAYAPLNFIDIEERAIALAQHIEQSSEELIDILLEYESNEVAVDEISRTLDLLKHLRENEQYFKLRIGQVTSFLPRNQPLYALACFVIIPSFMASEVWFRIPHTTKHFFSQVLDLLQITNLFPNIYVSDKERLDFLTERSAILKDPNNGDSKPVTDAVIFTGTLRNANQLRLIFSKQTLFITNGSGHNPVVLGANADINKAVKAVAELQFYNQGQDCAAPNSILVHKAVSDQFIDILRDEIKTTKVGHYRDKSSRVGPISEPDDLIRVQKFLIENIEWIDPSTPGLISTRDRIVAPTIIFKPLKYGGNFEEMYAPIIFVQEYEKDEDLKSYFEDKKYSPNAMYVTLYGTSPYVESLVNKIVANRLLHDDSTFIRNTHLHAEGVERGTKQYGGYGHGASSLSIHGKVIPMPTLPQRDIYDHIAKPLLERGSKGYVHESSRFTQIQYKNVKKILQIKTNDLNGEGDEKLAFGDIYLDTQQLQKTESRFVKISKDEFYTLLQETNTGYIEKLKQNEIKNIQELQKLLREKASYSLEEFESKLYAIPKHEVASTDENRQAQRTFFQTVYKLLFGTNGGPRLAEFLWIIEEMKIAKLLEVTDFKDE